MLTQEYKIIPMTEILGDDQTFRISLTGPCQNLVESIRKTGMLQPLVVQEFFANRFRIVSGFRRFEALRSLHISDAPVLCLNEKSSDLKLFEIAIGENRSQRELNSLEISWVIQRLSEKFAVQKQEIIGKYFIMLGLHSNTRIYELYAPLIYLDSDWQKAVLDGIVSNEIASVMTAQTPDDRQSFLHLLISLHLGKSRQKEFWMLLSDICSRDKMSIRQLIAQNLSPILQEEKLTSSQKTERSREILWGIRYPHFTLIKKRYDRLIKNAKCPPEIQVLPSPFFMDEYFNVHFQFKDESDYKNKIQFLKKLEKDKIIFKIVDLTSKDADQ